MCACPPLSGVYAGRSRFAHACGQVNTRANGYGKLAQIRPNWRKNWRKSAHASTPCWTGNAPSRLRWSPRRSTPRVVAGCSTGAQSVDGAATAAVRPRSPDHGGPGARRHAGVFLRRTPSPDVAARLRGHDLRAGARAGMLIAQRAGRGPLSRRPLPRCGGPYVHPVASTWVRWFGQ